MIRSDILKWFRRRYWQIEDALTDLIDWSPPPAPSIKPLPPARPKEQHRYANWNCVGVGFQRVTAEQANNEMLQQIFRQMAKHSFFEIRY
jgi:hypothetical protein